MWSRWWLQELSDPTYSDEVLPLLMSVLQPEMGRMYLDVGCGEGRVMRAVSDTGATVVGCDSNVELLTVARSRGPVLQVSLPSLAPFTGGSFAGAYLCLVLEHLEDERPMFNEAARVVAPGGVLALVVNHPMITSPDSVPILDPADGEVLWRFGRYQDEGGFTIEPAGAGVLSFYHRSLGRLLTSASEAGWDLERLVEQTPGQEHVARVPALEGQQDIPRLLGVRWRRRPDIGHGRTG